MAKQKLPRIACETCKQEFQPLRAWQRFCKDACREEARKEHSLAEYICTYCGLVASTVDHVPPKSVRPAIVELNLVKQYPFIEVRCCRECNSLLGDHPLWTVTQRREFLKRRLAQRYAKYLKIPKWTEKELNELEITLREKVLHGLNVRNVMLRRLDF